MEEHNQTKIYDALYLPLPVFQKYEVAFSVSNPHIFCSTHDRLLKGSQ